MQIWCHKDFQRRTARGRPIADGRARDADGSSSNHNIHIDFEVQSAFSQSFHLF